MDTKKFKTIITDDLRYLEKKEINNFNIENTIIYAQYTCDSNSYDFSRALETITNSTKL